MSDVFDSQMEFDLGKYAVTESKIEKTKRQNKIKQELVPSERKKGFTILPKTQEVMEIVETLSVEQKKREIENLAWTSLEAKLKDPERAPIDLLKMVLSPKFPKINFNVNMKLDNLDRKGLLEYLKHA